MYIKDQNKLCVIKEMNNVYIYINEVNYVYL